MKRPLPISQNVRVFVTAATIAAAVVGCAAAGNDGTGAAGMGGAGAGGTACTLADVNKIFMSTTTPANTGCTVINACHDNAGTAAGLDLTTAGWQNMLVGHAPSATAGTLKSMCAGMSLVYLNAGSSPATGLFLDKLNPAKDSPCGAKMPNLPPPLTTQQFACVQSFANTLTK
ncbi:MAG TPA: hypothetical protein VGK52_07695 [Polyangia bacterium]|jgi:hypothetical protein